MTSPQGHQFDYSVKILLVICSTYYPRQFDMSHNHVGKIIFDPQGTAEPQAPSLASKRERSGRVLDSRPRGRGFEPDLRLLKITKLQSQHSMLAIIGLPAKRHFNGVSRFAGRPIIACSWWFLEPHSPRKKKKKKLIRVEPPLTKLSGSAHDVSYLVLGRFHTNFGIKIFEIDFVIEI